MEENDLYNDIFRFPLFVNLHGKKARLMVRVIPFCGGMFYAVRGVGLETLHILRIDTHFTVMNADTIDDAIAAAVVDALRQPADSGDFPERKARGDQPS